MSVPIVYVVCAHLKSVKVLIWHLKSDTNKQRNTDRWTNKTITGTKKAQTKNKKNKLNRKWSWKYISRVKCYQNDLKNQTTCPPRVCSLLRSVVCYILIWHLMSAWRKSWDDVNKILMTLNIDMCCSDLCGGFIV